MKIPALFAMAAGLSAHLPVGMQPFARFPARRAAGQATAADMERIAKAEAKRARRALLRATKGGIQ